MSVRPRIHVDSILLRKRQLTKKNRPRSSPVPFSRYHSDIPFDEYKHCDAYCKEFEPDNEFCVSDIIDRGSGTCRIAKRCPLESKSRFQSLVNDLNRLLQLVYYIRYNHGSSYDAYIICVASKIKPSHYGISMNQLKCVKFPGGGIHYAIYPTTLYHYLQFMVHVDRAYQKGIPPHTYGPIVKKQYHSFARDISLWISSLVDFVNVHGGNVPEFSNMNKYTHFLTDKKLYLYRNIIHEPDTLQQHVLNYIGY